MCQIRKQMVKELAGNIMSVSAEDLEAVIKAIRKVKGKANIFVYGRGREMMAISAFAVRLNRLGYPAYIVGECHVPPIREGDLFLVTNGRNMLQAHEAQMRVAKEQNAHIVVFTAHPQGGFTKIPADKIVYLPGQTLDDEIDTEQFYQTMGTAYEQALLILLDCIAVRLVQMEEFSDLWKAMEI